MPQKSTETIKKDLNKILEAKYSKSTSKKILQLYNDNRASPKIVKPNGFNCRPDDKL